MPSIYVAQSKNLQKWGWDVGLSKHLYKLGIADDDGAKIASDLNGESHAGCSDWKLLDREAIDTIDETAMLERVAKKESAVDPNYYPRIKNASGIFKVKVDNVEHALLVEKALANQELKPVKVTPKAIAAYLLRAALS